MGYTPDASPYANGIGQAKGQKTSTKIIVFSLLSDG